MNYFQCFCRGTEGFAVSLSTSVEDWTRVVSGNLPDVRGKRCNERPLDKRFKFRPRRAKFVMFNVTSFYGFGGGLDYMRLSGPHDSDSLRERKPEAN